MAPCWSRPHIRRAQESLYCMPTTYSVHAFSVSVLFYENLKLILRDLETFRHGSIIKNCIWCNADTKEQVHIFHKVKKSKMLGAFVKVV